MNIDWQQIVSLMIVGISAMLLVRGWIHSRRRAKLRACGHDCGCSSNNQLEDIQEQIINKKSK